MMRIGIITGEYPPMQGGVGAYSSILAECFVHQEHHVSVLSTSQALTHLPQIHLNNSIEHWDIPTLYRIRKWALSEQLDIINLQFETAAFGMSPWVHFIPDVLRNTVPVVTTFHDLLVPYLFPKAGKLRDWIVMHLARASAGVITTNHEDMQQIVHLPDTSMIPIGSNILAKLPQNYSYENIRTQIGASTDDFVITYFGFINRSKGIETLIKAVADLRAENIPVRLLMIGGRTGTSDPTNAAYAKEIDALIDSLKLQSVIHWTGFVNDTEVAQFLTASGAVVLPFRDGASYRRGSLMAAIQHGCAIITTQPQIEIPAFKHGDNLLLTPVGDAQSIVEAVKMLVQSKALQDHLKQGALKLSELFDWEQIAIDCVNLFQKVKEDGCS